jgi:hypothetical protein
MCPACHLTTKLWTGPVARADRGDGVVAECAFRIFRNGEVLVGRFPGERSDEVAKARADPLENCARKCVFVVVPDRSQAWLRCGDPFGMPMIVPLMKPAP